MKNGMLMLFGHPVKSPLDETDPAGFAYAIKPFPFTVEGYPFKLAVIRPPGDQLFLSAYQVIQFPDGGHAMRDIGIIATGGFDANPGWAESVARDWIRLNAADAETSVEDDIARMAWI